MLAAGVGPAEEHLAGNFKFYSEIYSNETWEVGAWGSMKLPRFLYNGINPVAVPLLLNRGFSKPVLCGFVNCS